MAPETVAFCAFITPILAPGKSEVPLTIRSPPIVVEWSTSSEPKIIVFPWIVAPEEAI